MIVRGLFLIGSLVLALHGCGGGGGTALDGAITDSRAGGSDTAAEGDARPAEGDARPAEDRPVLSDQPDAPAADAAVDAAVDAPLDGRADAVTEIELDARADVVRAVAGCCCRPGSICSAFCVDMTKACCVAMIDIECLSNGGAYQSSCSVGGSCQ
jgi:hypothetical protein